MFGKCFQKNRLFLLHIFNNNHNKLSTVNDKLIKKFYRRLKMKKFTKILMALVLIIGVTFGFAGSAFADEAYPGDGTYKVEVFHDSSMATKPMKGKVDSAFIKAVVKKNTATGKYDVTFHTTPIKYMGVSGEIEEINIGGSISNSGPVFELKNVDLNSKNEYLSANGVSCKMKIAKFIHKSVSVFFKLTRIN